MIGGFRFFLCFSGVLILASPAFADQDQPLSEANSSRKQERKSLEASAVPATVSKGADCSFKTNDCELCTKDSGKIICSSVGIACEPTEWRCLEPVEVK